MEKPLLWVLDLELFIDGSLNQRICVISWWKKRTIREPQRVWLSTIPWLMLHSSLFRRSLEGTSLWSQRAVLSKPCASPPNRFRCSPALRAWNFILEWMVFSKLWILDSPIFFLKLKNLGLSILAMIMTSPCTRGTYALSLIGLEMTLISFRVSGFDS